MANRSESRGGREAGYGRNRRNDDDNGMIVDFSDGQPVYKNNPHVRGYQERGNTYGQRGRENSYKTGNRKGAKRGEYEKDMCNGSATHRDYGEERRCSGKRHPDGGRREGFKGRAYYDRHSESKPNADTYRGAYDSTHDKRPQSGVSSGPGAVPPEQERELPNIIMGRNPVKEAIRSGRSIDKLLISRERDGSLNEIMNLARDAKLVIREVDRAKLDELCMPFGHNGKTGNHQGVVAEIPGVEYCEIDDILAYARDRGEAPFIIMLDGIEDPHNLGSIIRSAECAGAHGIIITKRRCSPVTAAVVKASAGAVEYMRVARVVNLSVAVDRLKREGLWVAGADMDGTGMSESNLKGALALVIGGEGGGITRLVKEKCDLLVSVPIKGRIESLNASVAAAVLMFEKNRQDSAGN